MKTEDESVDRLSDRELATMLAALRLWQRSVESGRTDCDAFFPQLDDVKPLTLDEIDELCERLNLGGTSSQD